MPTESYQRILRAPARSLVFQSFQLPLKSLNTIDWLRNKKKHRRMKNASDVRLTRTEPRHNNQTQNNGEMEFCHNFCLPFLFQLRTFSSSTFCQQFLSIINFTISSLPATLFFASCLSFLHLSRFLSYLFSISFSPYFDFFFRFTVMSRVLLSLFLTLSFHSLISQRHLRTFSRRLHMFCPFFPCWFSFPFFYFSLSLSRTI